MIYYILEFSKLFIINKKLWEDFRKRKFEHVPVRF